MHIRTGRPGAAQRSRSFLGFATIGAAAAGANLLLIHALTSTGLHYLAAFVVAFVVVNAAAALANGTLVFGQAGGNAPGWLGRWYLVAATSLLANTAALALLVERAGLPHLPAVAILVVANAPINFAVHRLYTYRRHAGRA